MQNDFKKRISQISDEVLEMSKRYVDMPTGVFLNTNEAQNKAQKSYSREQKKEFLDELSDDRRLILRFEDHVEDIKEKIAINRPSDIDDLVESIEKLEIDIASIKERNIELKRELELLILQQEKEKEHKSVSSEQESLEAKIKKIREGAQAIKEDVTEALQDSSKKKVNITYDEKKIDYKEDHGHTQ